MGPWDGVGDGGGAAEEPECVRMAPAASRDGMRRSEKAEVPGGGLTRGSEAEWPENVRAHTKTQTQTHNHAASAGVSTAV